MCLQEVQRAWTAPDWAGLHRCSAVTIVNWQCNVIIEETKKKRKEEPSMLSVWISVRVAQWRLTCSVVLKLSDTDCGSMGRIRKCVGFLRWTTITSARLRLQSIIPLLSGRLEQIWALRQTSCLLMILPRFLCLSLVRHQGQMQVGSCEERRPSICSTVLPLLYHGQQKIELCEIPELVLWLFKIIIHCCSFLLLFFFFFNYVTAKQCRETVKIYNKIILIPLFSLGDRSSAGVTWK